MQYIRQFPQLTPFYERANHVDVKVVEGNVSLRAFLAGLVGYQPEWVSFLYRVRGVFVRFLGMRQNHIPQPERLRPESVPMIPGQMLSFFKVEMAEEDCYWVGSATDSHLHAEISVVVEPLKANHRRFYVMTTVHYHNRAGRIYFNVIRPFHYLIVEMMTRAAVRDTR